MILRRPLRRLGSLLLTGALLSALMPAAVAQDVNSPTLFLRPHCEDPDPTMCAFYDVRDPTTLVSPPIKIGETLDMDVVLFNPKSDVIKGFRVWLAYDSAALEGTLLEISPAFPVVVPGQSDFAPQTGHVKMAADATPGQEPKDLFVPLARIQFKIPANAQAKESPLTFHDLQESVDGHVVVTTVSAPTTNIIAGPLGSLLIDVRGADGSTSGAQSSSVASVVPIAAVSSAPASSVSSVAPIVSSSSSLSSSSISSIASSSSSSSMSMPMSSAPSTSFELLQVQNIGIGTKDTTLQVTWDTLSHPKLQGYNVYYGTLPGRYLQRKSVSVAAVGTIIRDLPKGETYYVAVRGVDDQNHETAFSKEVSVEIGNPATASAVLGSVTNLSDSGPGEAVNAPENPLDTTDNPPPRSVPGDTGAPSALLLLLLASAVTGTLFAVRRQLTAAKHFPR